MTMNFNVDPYYDDFDETKGFYRILIKPGVAVQARELTQIQTLLQNQISNFANSVYREGSVVTGGEHMLDDSVHYIKIQSAGVDLSAIEGKYIREETSTGIKWALVKKYVPATSTDPITLYATIVSGSISAFGNSTQLDVYTSTTDETSLYSVTTASDNASGLGLLFHVNQGVFYTNKTFVFCPAQSVVVSKYDRKGSAVIGLSVVESIITADIDESLLDPAFGQYNYAAPGADRYMIMLSLTTQPYTEIAQARENFIELVHVREGNIMSDKRLPLYANIGDTMARRTYDESGDYIVRPFVPKISQDQNDAVVGVITSIQSDTEVTLSSVAPFAFTGLRLKRERGGIGYDLTGTISIGSDSPTKLIGVNSSFNSELAVGDTIKTGADSNLILEISPGKAYVKGYEIETNGPTNVRLNKSRSTNIETEREINTYYGNYTVINSIHGSLPNINTGTLVDVHDSITPSTSSVIGTAHVIGVDYISGTGSSATYRIEFESFNMSKPFETAVSFAVSTDSYATTTFKALVDSTAIVNSKTQLYEANYDTLVYSIPPSNIKSISNVDYYYKKKYNTITVTNGVANISTDTSHDRFVSVSSPTQYNENFIVVVTAVSSGTFTTGQLVPLDENSRTITVTAVSGSPGQAVIDFNDSTFNGSVDIIATIRTSNDIRRTKSLVSGFVKTVTVNTTGRTSLQKADVYKLNNVYELLSTDTYKGDWSSSTSYVVNDVVTKSGVAYRSLGSNTNQDPATIVASWSVITDASQYYILDNGQTNSHYGYGSISRISPVSTSIQVIVSFDYFTHSGAGYISASSYPLSFNEIPSFTDTRGTVYKLRDCIDFRPRMVDDQTTQTYQSFTFPKFSANTITTVEYYLQKVDRVVMTREGIIKVIEGTPSVTRPVAPSSQDDSMTLYLLTYSAYTESNKDVSIEVIPNKRYTMKDIGAIDTRIKNIEYYTALSLVESQVSNQNFTDANGLPLFKNGYLVDSFKGHDVGDVSNPEYNCSIDTEKGELRPPFDIRATYFLRDESYVSNNTTTTNNGLMTVPYTESIFINQNIASSAISVNPFDVVAFSGTMKITPESDVWIDIDSAPDIVQNVDGTNDNFANYQSLGTVWNSWETIYGGKEQETGTNTKTVDGNAVTSKTYDVFENRKKYGVETLVAPPGVVQSTSTKTISKTAIPYARSKDIAFEVYGMTPNVELFLYIDGRHMSNYIVDQSMNGVTTVLDSNGDPVTDKLPFKTLMTDKTGYASGVIHFPSNDNTKFLCGKHTLALCDNQIDPMLATCWAEVPYTSEGTIQVDQKTIVSTRGGYQVTRNVSETELFKTRSEERVVSSVPTYNGPGGTYSLAVDQSTVREGNTITFLLTANNVPVNRTYTGTLTGSSGLTNDDITGATLGSTVSLTTKGTLQSNTASLPIQINLDAINETDETLTLTIEIPADASHPEYGGPLSLSASAVITNSVAPTYKVTSPAKIEEGKTAEVVFSATGLTSDTTISWSITGVSTSHFTGVRTGTTTLTTSNSYTSTLSLPIVDTSGIDTDSLTITFTLPDGTTKQATIDIVDVMPVYPTYKLSRSAGIIDEGSSVTITLTTENVSDGTLVPYTITGVNPDDINISKTGNFTVNSNTASVIITAVSDFKTETNQTMTITIPDGTATSVLIHDTSKTIIVTSDKISVAEGSTVTFTVVAEGVNDGTLFNYEIVPVSVGLTAADFGLGSLTGAFTALTGGTVSKTFNIASDGLAESAETFYLKVTHPTATSATANSPDVTIEPTPATPWTYLFPSSKVVNEGGGVSIVLKTAYLVPGTVLGYEITGASLSDFVGLTSLTGTFPTVDSNGSTKLDLNVKSNTIVESLSKTFVVTLKINNVATTKTASITIVDTTPEVVVIKALNSSGIETKNVIEGDSIKIALTSNAKTGTIYNYKITGNSISTGDFVGLTSLSGSFPALAGGVTTLPLTIASDGDIDALGETFTVSITNATSVVNPVSVTIGASVKVVNLTCNKTSIKEGETALYTVTTKNIENGTQYKYMVSGTASSSDYTFDTTSPLTIHATGVEGVAYLQVTANTDLNIENDETITVALVDYPNQAITVTIKDTTPPPTYAIELRKGTSDGPIQNVYDEGDVVYVKVTTTNVADGTKIPFAITGTVDVTDFDSVFNQTESNGQPVLSGTIAITSNSFAGTIKVKADNITEGKEYVKLSVNGGVAAATFTVNDSTSLPTVYGLDGPSGILQTDTPIYDVFVHNLGDKGLSDQIYVDVTATATTGKVPSYSLEYYSSNLSKWTPVTNRQVYVFKQSEPGYYLGKFRINFVSDKNTSSTSTITVKLFNTSIANTPIKSLTATYKVVAPVPVTVTKDKVVPAKIGDFLDSSLTIVEAIAKYKDVSGGFNSRGKSDAVLLQYGNAVKDGYKTICNRNPNIAGFNTWMEEMCMVSSNTYTNFKSVDLITTGRSNDGAYDDYKNSKWLRIATAQQEPVSGEITDHGCGTVYRNVTVKPGINWVSMGSGHGITSARIYTATTPSKELFKIYHKDSYVNRNTIKVGLNDVTINNVSFTVSGTQEVQAVLEFKYTYAYNTDAGWGRFFNLYQNSVNPSVFPTTGTPYWSLGSHLTAETVPVLTSSSILSISETITRFNTRLTKVATRNNDLAKNRPSFVACTTDPLAETFFIDEAKYPNGVFLSRFDLYFRSKDDSIPLWAEIRPTDNGYPSSNTKIPLTTMTIHPEEVKISDDASIATPFNFGGPVFFKPGEYAIVVGSNSSKYYAYISEMGAKQLGTNNVISKQPYIGSLFKSQNASTWTATQEQDLMFALYQCKFDTTQTYEMVLDNAYENTNFATFDFDTIKLVSSEIDFGEKTDIAYSIANTPIGSIIDGYSVISPNKNVPLNTRKRIDSTGDTKLKVMMKTNDSNISPVIDMQRLSAFVIENIISTSSGLTVSEESAYGGNAYAKYVSRNLTLAEGFDATGLRVILDINRPQGTSIKVYAKVLSAEDGDAFIDKPYQEIPVVSKPKVYSNNDDDFIIDEYVNDSITYVGKAGSYSTFRTFAIKIVMFSDNPVKVPRIKNLRAIATS